MSNFKYVAYANWLFIRHHLESERIISLQKLPIKLIVFEGKYDHIICVIHDVSTELAKQDVKPKIYSYNELRVATRDFNPDNKLGEGGFGVVYKVHGLVGGFTMVHYSALFEELSI